MKNIDVGFNLADRELLHSLLNVSAKHRIYDDLARTKAAMIPLVAVAGRDALDAAHGMNPQVVAAAQTLEAELDSALGLLTKRH